MHCTAGQAKRIQVYTDEISRVTWFKNADVIPPQHLGPAEDGDIQRILDSEGFRTVFDSLKRRAGGLSSNNSKVIAG